MTALIGEGLVVSCPRADVVGRLGEPASDVVGADRAFIYGLPAGWISTGNGHETSVTVVAPNRNM